MPLHTFSHVDNSVPNMEIALACVPGFQGFVLIYRDLTVLLVQQQPSVPPVPAGNLVEAPQRIFEYCLGKL